jgi:hypothetical protein
MPLSTDKIQNSPITGPELARYASALLVEELEVRSVPDWVREKMKAAMEAGMRNDFTFNGGTAYPGISIEIKARVHWSERIEACAFSISPVFTHLNPLPKAEVMVRSIFPPLAQRDEDERCEAFTLNVKVENPNLIRIHYDIPIIVTSKLEPRPGQMFPEFSNERQIFDPDDYPEPTRPTVIDETDEYAAKWGVKRPLSEMSDQAIASLSPEAMQEKIETAVVRGTGFMKEVMSSAARNISEERATGPTVTEAKKEVMPNPETPETGAGDIRGDRNDTPAPAKRHKKGGQK